RTAGERSGPSRASAPKAGRAPGGLGSLRVNASPHASISFQNATVRSATASSLSNCITRARPAWASGRRSSAALRRRSAPASAAGSSGGTMAPASPITSGVAPAPVPTTATSCAIASATTCADCSAQLASPRDGCTSTSSSAQSRAISSGGSPPVQRIRGAGAARDRSLEPPQRAAAPRAREEPERQLHVLEREQHHRELELAGHTHHLLADARGRLLLDLHHVGALVAQQRDERALPKAGFVGVGPVSHRDGEHLDAVLPLPPRLDGAAQRGFAQALRDADGDVEVAGRERAQLAAVRGVQVDRGDDQDAAHGLKRGTRNAERGTSARRSTR